MPHRRGNNATSEMEPGPFLRRGYGTRTYIPILQGLLDASTDVLVGAQELPQEDLPPAWLRLGILRIFG